MCPHTHKQALTRWDMHAPLCTQRCSDGERERKSQKWKEGDERRRTPRDAICSSPWHWGKGVGEGPGPLQVSERQRRMAGTSARPGRLPFLLPTPQGGSRELGGQRFPWRHSPIPGEATVWAPKMAASEGQRPFCFSWGLRGRGERAEVS